LAQSINVNDEVLLKKKQSSLEMVKTSFRWDKIAPELIRSINHVIAQTKKRSVSEATEV
jgi:hypothetical protein